MGITIAVIIVLACVESARRKSPMNFILLLVFTLCEGFMLGVFASYFDVEAILIAVAITAGTDLETGFSGYHFGQILS